MATTADKAVNGNYGTHHSYDHAEAYQPAQASEPSQSNAQFGEQNPVVSAPSAPAVEEDKPIPKEMIGWYFVEQYYNTMSKTPDRLHVRTDQIFLVGFLKANYYSCTIQKNLNSLQAMRLRKYPLLSANKYVFPCHSPSSPYQTVTACCQRYVLIMLQRIGDRIKELDIQDCKVRVTNVDSQESAKGILVQVIGEMSNKAAPHRKFVQTFVLAEQPTGYYVLNDIFRYIVEEEEEEQELENGGSSEEVVSALPAESVPATLTSSDDPVQQQHDVEQVDHKLEQDVLRKPLTDQEPAAISSTDEAAPSEPLAVEDAEDVTTSADDKDIPAQDPEEVAESAIIEDIVQAEKPRDPDPTPVASPPQLSKAAPVQVQSPAAPPKPAPPQTWAERLAASKTSTSNAGPNDMKAAPPATPAPLKPKTANSSTKESMTPPALTSEEAPNNPQQNGTSGWQMAGSDSKQRQGRQHSQSISSNQGNVLGYVKNVTDKVDASILKTVLAGFGRLEYFDVSRQKV